MRRISGIFVAVVVVAAAALAAPPALAAELQKMVAETDYVPHGMGAGLFLAKQKGWFKEEGLDVEVLDGKGSNTTIQLTATGQIDVGFAQLSAMAAGVSNGLPVISIMGIVQAGDGGIIVPANSGWTTLKDLKGKRILVAPGSGTATFLDAFLKAGGFTRADFTIMNADISAQAPIYINGNADGVLNLAFFFLPVVNKAKPSKIILFSQYGLHIPGYGLLVRKDALEPKAAALRKFVEVQQRTWAYIFAGHEKEAVDAILAQRAGQRLDPEVLMGQLKADMPYFLTPAVKGKPLGTQAESDWQSTLASMQAVGVLKSPVKPADVYTNQFISDKYVLK